MKISAVIPCYNDGSFLKPIVDEIQKSRFVKEIIVIDDGSSQETKQLLAEIKNITLVTHATNQGKAKAMLTGLKKADYELVLFIDSDLMNFSYKHINKMWKTLQDKNLDMVLGIRDKEIFYMKWLGFSQAYTGERIIKRSILIENLSLFDVDNYLIEPSINKLFFNSYKVGGVNLKGLSQIYKLQKYGLSGLFKDVQMYKSYLNYLGMREFLFQLSFARTK